MIRAVLASTLSSVYGIYSGFELCENAAVAGREEYLDSEKYQLKERDWDAIGNIKEWISQLNRIRQQNRALQFYDNLRFYRADSDSILFYGKMTLARDNIILVVVNLDPFRRQNSYIYVPVEDFGATPTDEYEVHDLLTDARYRWRGTRNYVELDPAQPAHVFRVRRPAPNGTFA
jgi:starch synthase (maltosyl-transferring)